MRNAPQSAKVKNVKYLVETFLTYELNKIKNDFTSDEMCDIFRRYWSKQKSCYECSLLDAIGF